MNIRHTAIALLAAALCAAGAQAAEGADEDAKKGGRPFAFTFYGHIRADLFYNTRANNETVDGLFYMYPKDHDYDPLGQDLNATPQGSFYLLYTRAGVDVSGPRLGNAATSAKIEVDFRGSGTSYAMPRIRHAYVNLDWQGRNDVLIGQTWHPLFGEVSPSMLNLSTGAPFQPFSRSPQVRYRYRAPFGLQATVAAVWQQQYASAGPDGKSPDYLKYSGVPEVFAGLDYKSPSGWQAGVGAELLSLKPRKYATVDGVKYKVSERVTSVSLEAHAKYVSPMWRLGAKTTLANNLTQCSMLGGFAVTAVDAATGQMTYTPFRHSATWVNAVYGRKWQPGLFVGYLKNLGTGSAITGTVYGTGLDVDQLLSVNLQLSYNVKAWKLGVEVEPSVAWYGTTDLSDGRVRATHSVANWRFLCAAIYSFTTAR